MHTTWFVKRSQGPKVDTFRTIFGSLEAVVAWGSGRPVTEVQSLSVHENEDGREVAAASMLSVLADGRGTWLRFRLAD